ILFESLGLPQLGFKGQGNLLNSRRLLGWRERPTEYIPFKLLYHVSEDGFKIADGALEDANALVQPTQNALLDGLLDPQVVDPNNGGLLPDAVEASDALLDLHGVPWKVVVEHRVAEL